MSNFSLYKRITETGTITEPRGNPDPRFALPSTVNWMRALALLCADKGFDFGTCQKFYSGANKRAMSQQKENSVLEHLLFSLHQLSALQAVQKIQPQADVARVGVVAWYYGIYWAATAMVAAQDGTVQDNHAATARTWHSQFPSRHLVIAPFDLYVTTLVKKDVEPELVKLRSGRPRTNLVDRPVDVDEAYDAIVAYLSGTVSWSQWKKQEEVKCSKEFKAIRVNGRPATDFRSKETQQLRDSRLKGSPLSFLHQAFRYRGKANYREGLYLAHGKSVEQMISGFVRDMSDVLEGFLVMAGAFASRRLGATLWDSFLEDLEKHRAFTTSPKDVWATD